VPGYALSAGRAERHWHDESAAIDALTDLGLARDDLIAETMRSPKQVELRAKARGLRIPPELIVSHRSGVSLVRGETRTLGCPDGTSSRDRFPRHSKPSERRKNYD
jgi:hypothetical protein